MPGVRGPGADPPPGGFGAFKNLGYGAEVVWNISALGLDPSHSYRLQFMVHDGDQNKSGGDVGEACTTLPGLRGDAANRITNDTPKAPITQVLELGRAIPNPFRETMRFAYRVSAINGSNVDIRIFDLAGRRVRTLFSGQQGSGQYETTWDGRSDDGMNLNRGVYFLHAQIGGQAQTTRIMYVK